MNKAIKKQWVEALRSGDYPQTQGCLRDNAGYCCMGVLEDLAEKAEVVTRKGSITLSENTGAQIYVDTMDDHDQSWSVLTKSTQRWADLDDFNPVVAGRHLSTWNDTETPFTDIADLIEKYL